MQTVKQQVAKKTKGFQDTEKRFTEVVELKGGIWTIAAIVEIGKAADNYADSIYNSYVPYWFDQDQTDMWKMRLEDQAYVYNERAVEFYELALQKAYESNIYNDYTASRFVDWVNCVQTTIQSLPRLFLRTPSL